MNLLNEKILIVDDTVENLNLLKNILKDDGYELYLSKDGNKAFDIAKKIVPDLILLDIMMPIIDGYDTCKLLKDNDITKNIPIIFLSALDNPEDKIKAFNLGAVDYISKPFNAQEVLVRVKSHLSTSTMIKSLNNLIEKSFHEIYTPLSVIQSGLEMQVLEHGDTQYLQSIQAASRNLNVIADDLYYTIKKEVVDFVPDWIELVPFIDEQIKYLQPIANKKDITFTLDKTIDDPMIYINDLELKKVLLNILTNAIKYTFKGTNIEILISELEDGYISMEFINQGKTIKDTEKIFQNQYQEDNSRLGLGIGLDIVSSVCKKNNIQIDVQSKDEKTTFKLIYKEKI